MRTTISTKGQIVLPAELREQDAISAGDNFEIKKLRRGEYLVKRVAEAPNKGLADWLLSCPVKDYFQAIDSESTDSL
ncbi:MAG TPA: AbrB/MazE/SpoVT family DNA-binding domain-containing protein [Verrucomicrobiae bacterium]|nr:AbrB/MazE/SpoVT family DNA-binding domain-containing protein [Verrucomicrobiae bacterium]